MREKDETLPARIRELERQRDRLHRENSRLAEAKQLWQARTLELVPVFIDLFDTHYRDSDEVLDPCTLNLALQWSCPECTATLVEPCTLCGNCEEV